MSELATLRKLRASNSKLMKGNLALLMSIREVDSEMQREWLQLQQYCELLEQRGIVIPPSCLELMGNNDADIQSDHDTASAKESTRANMDYEDQGSQLQATKQNVDMHCEEQLPQNSRPSSRLSVRSVLNDDSSEAEGDTIMRSGSEQGSAEDS